MFRRSKKSKGDDSSSSPKGKGGSARKSSGSKPRTSSTASSAPNAVSGNSSGRSALAVSQQRPENIQSVPGIQAIDLNEFLGSGKSGVTSPRSPSQVQLQDQGSGKKKRKKKKKNPATIEELDAIFRDPDDFGRYLGVVGPDEQQEVLFICEIEQLLERAKSFDAKMVAAHEDKIGQMYLKPTGAGGHYQVKSLSKKTRRKLQESIESDSTDFDTWRLAQHEMKRKLCKDSIPTFLEFINRQIKSVTDEDQLDFKYVFSIHDVFRNPACGCAFFLYMLKDRRHRLMLFWMDLVKERVGDLRKSLEADPNASVDVDMCLKLEAIHHKYVHSEMGAPSVFEGESLGDLLESHVRFERKPTEVEMRQLGRLYVERLGNMLAKMDKIIRRDCWPDFSLSDLYKGAVERVYDEKGDKTRKIVKDMHKKLKEYAASQEMYVAFTRDAQPSLEPSLLCEKPKKLVEYVAVLVPEAHDEYGRTNRARFVRRWPLDDRDGLPLPSANHLAALCFRRGDPVHELMQRIYGLEDDRRLFTRNIHTTLHTYTHNEPNQNHNRNHNHTSNPDHLNKHHHNNNNHKSQSHTTTHSLLSSHKTASIPWGFDSATMRIVADCTSVVGARRSSKVVDPSPLDNKGSSGGTHTGGESSNASGLFPRRVSIAESGAVPVVPGFRLFNFVLTVMGGSHIYAACLQVDPYCPPGFDLEVPPPPAGSSSAKPDDSTTQTHTNKEETTPPHSPSARFEYGPAEEAAQKPPQRFSICVTSSLPLCTFLRDALLPLVDAVRRIRAELRELEEKREAKERKKYRHDDVDDDDDREDIGSIGEEPSSAAAGGGAGLAGGGAATSSDEQRSQRNQRSQRSHNEGKFSLGDTLSQDHSSHADSQADPVLSRLVRSPEMGRLVALLQETEAIQILNPSTSTSTSTSMVSGGKSAAATREEKQQGEEESQDAVKESDVEHVQLKESDVEHVQLEREAAAAERDDGAENHGATEAAKHEREDAGDSLEVEDRPLSRRRKKLPSIVLRDNTLEEIAEEQQDHQEDAKKLISLEAPQYNLAGLRKISGKGAMPRMIQRLMACMRAPDFSMAALLSRLHPKRVLLSLEYLLMERKVLIISHHASVLTAAAAALRSLLFPFEWRYLFVPVLAPSMFQYLDCPTPWLVGVSAAHRHEVLQIASVQQEALIVDLENDQVFSSSGDLPARIPICVSAYLLENIRRNFQPDYSLHLPATDLLSDDVPLDSVPVQPVKTQQEKEQQQQQQQHNDDCAHATQKEADPDPEAAKAVDLKLALGKAWAHLLSGYRRFCSAWIERDDPGVVFDAPTFLNTKPKYAVPFLKEVFKTLAFRSFLESRAEAASDGLKGVKNDLFDVLEEALSHHSHDSRDQISVDIHVVPRPRFKALVTGLNAEPPCEEGQPALVKPPEIPKTSPAQSVLKAPNVSRVEGSPSPRLPTQGSKEFDREIFEDAISISDQESEGSGTPNTKSNSTETGTGTATKPKPKPLTGSLDIKVVDTSDTTSPSRHRAPTSEPVTPEKPLSPVDEEGESKEGSSLENTPVKPEEEEEVVQNGDQEGKSHHKSSEPSNTASHTEDHTEDDTQAEGSGLLFAPPTAASSSTSQTKNQSRFSIKKAASLTIGAADYGQMGKGEVIDLLDDDQHRPTAVSPGEDELPSHIGESQSVSEGEEEERNLAESHVDSKKEQTDHGVVCNEEGASA